MAEILTPSTTTREHLDQRIEELAREVALDFFTNTDKGKAWHAENWQSGERVDAATDAVRAVPEFSGLFYWAILHYLVDSWQYVHEQLFEEAYRVANEEERANIHAAVEAFLNRS